MLACISNSSTLQPIPLPLPPQQSPVTTLAIRTLAELALSISLSTLCTPFTATPLLLWKGLIVQSALNLTIRSFCAANNHSQDNWLTASIFAFGSIQNILALIHEMGHAMMAESFLQRACSKIRLHPYVSGVTSFIISKPSTLGIWTGLHRIQPIITAAGPLLALLVSSVQLWVGLKKLRSKPILAKVLISSACINFFVHIRYALSARGTHPHQLMHDFVELKSLGLNPLYAAIAIFAIPSILIGQAVWKTPLHPKSAPLALLPCHI